MQEILFWCIVIPVMCVIGAILAIRADRWNIQKPDNSTKSTRR